MYVYCGIFILHTVKKITFVFIFMSSDRVVPHPPKEDPCVSRAYQVGSECDQTSAPLPTRETCSDYSADKRSRDPALSQNKKSEKRLIGTNSNDTSSHVPVWVSSRIVNFLLALVDVHNVTSGFSAEISTVPADAHDKQISGFKKFTQKLPRDALAVSRPHVNQHKD